MALTSGTRLGPYEILAPVGAGGMSEVYRARDTRLGRDVAVKILSTLLSSDPDLKLLRARSASRLFAHTSQYLLPVRHRLSGWDRFHRHGIFGG